MRKILLLDARDTGKPNLALAKIEKYCLDKGDKVVVGAEIFADWADAIYISAVFSDDRHICESYKKMYGDKVFCGGTGYDPKVKLPGAIEMVKPRINWGFTTRGCTRRCPWCVVPEKEGDPHIVGDLLDIWDGKSKEVTIIDNNILAIPSHFQLICRQACKNNIKIDFNQGLDFRFLNNDIIDDLKKTRLKQYRFSFDDIVYADAIKKAIEKLKRGGISWCKWYVLVGFNSTPQQDIARLNTLRLLDQRAYVQRYNQHKGKIYIPLAQWANQDAIFAKKTLGQFFEMDKKNKKHKHLFDGMDLDATCDSIKKAGIVPAEK